MPSTYAHYRLGFRTLSHLDPPIQELIRRNRKLFDLGLHGPDIFFFYNPFVKKDPIRDLARKIHHTTGRDFFSPAVRQLKLQPDEGAESYLFGVLAHFTLDSVCHPYVNASAGADASHVEMEVEFDRALLEYDGKPEPHRQVICRHIRLEGKQDGERIARFYSDATARTVKRSVANMAWMTAALAAPKGIRRTVIGSGYLGNHINEHMMFLQPNLRCAEHTPQLMKRYIRAEVLYPKLARQLWNHLHAAGKLGEEFDEEFG